MSASEDEKPTGRYEFGPFRIDPEKETLQRDGELVPLTPKTFQILLVLVRHSKEVVTKDDLMKTVWPDTFVEEANLSRNIFMLRKALGDSPEDRRYIVTVPGRGYRLTESVHLIPEQDVRIVAATHSRVQIEVKETKPWRWIALAAVVLIGVAGVVWRSIPQRRTVLSAKDTVVLADFTNATGDAMFDDTLRQGLAVQLEQSPFLSLISEQRARHMLGLMGRAPDAPLTPEVARAVCERTGSAAVLEGSIQPLGTQYVLELRAKNCRTGEVLDQEQVQAARKEDVLNALGQIAGRLRNHLGESLTTVQEHNTPLAEATTPSLEALEAYSAGWKTHTSSGAFAALPLLKRAVEIDPNFALAHATLGRLYADLDEADLSAGSTTRAWQLRDRVSDRERFLIAANYEMLTTGDLEEARETCEAWAQTYPRENLPHTMLSGYINKSSGRYERALSEAQKAIELDPDFAIAYFNLAVNNVYLGRLDEAKNALSRATGRGLAIDEFLMLEHDIAFLQGNTSEMERVASRARMRSGGETWIANKEGFVLSYAGRRQLARTRFQSAVNDALQASQTERAAVWQTGAALQEAFFGDRMEARKQAEAALKLSTNREVQYGAALALALSGDSAHAQTLADDLEKRFPQDTSVRFSYLPVIRGALALSRRDSARALEALQVGAPNELGAPRGSFGGLYPAYLRGQAYLATHEGAKAAIEFQKILDHPGVVNSDPIGALAHLQLGRAFASEGDKTKARGAYVDFFAIWKDADSDIPILKAARTEYASLN